MTRTLGNSPTLPVETLSHCGTVLEFQLELTMTVTPRLPAPPPAHGDLDSSCHGQYPVGLCDTAEDLLAVTDMRRPGVVALSHSRRRPAALTGESLIQIFLYDSNKWLLCLLLQRMQQSVSKKRSHLLAQSNMRVLSHHVASQIKNYGSLDTILRC